MTRKADTMIDILQTISTGHAAGKPSFALSALCVAIGVGLLAGCAADRPMRTPDVGVTVRADLRKSVV